jgi:hypothetical protein
MPVGGGDGRLAAGHRAPRRKLEVGPAAEREAVVAAHDAPGIVDTRAILPALDPLAGIDLRFLDIDQDSPPRTERHFARGRAPGSKRVVSGPPDPGGNLLVEVEHLIPGSRNPSPAPAAEDGESGQTERGDPGAG